MLNNPVCISNCMQSWSLLILSMHLFAIAEDARIHLWIQHGWIQTSNRQGDTCVLFLLSANLWISVVLPVYGAAVAETYHGSTSKNAKSNDVSHSQCHLLWRHSSHLGCYSTCDCSHVELVNYSTCECSHHWPIMVSGHIFMWD